MSIYIYTLHYTSFKTFVDTSYNFKYLLNKHIENIVYSKFYLSQYIPLSILSKDDFNLNLMTDSWHEVSYKPMIN